MLFALYIVLSILGVVILGAGAVWIVIQARQAWLNAQQAQQVAAAQVQPVAAAQIQTPQAGQNWIGPFAYLIAGFTAVGVAYGIRYPWNGVVFMIIATGLFFIQQRLSRNSWEAVWAWFTEEVAVPAREPNGVIIPNQIAFMSNRRISAFVLSLGFCTLCFRAFFGKMTPDYPDAILAFLLGIIWFIGTGRAANLIDKIAEKFSYTAMIAVAGSAMVVTIAMLFDEQIKPIIPQAGFISLVLGVMGLAFWKKHHGAAIALCAVSGLGIVSISTHLIGRVFTKPLAVYLEAVEKYQGGGAKEIDLRILPAIRRDQKIEKPATEVKKIDPPPSMGLPAKDADTATLATPRPVPATQTAPNISQSSTPSVTPTAPDPAQTQAEKTKISAIMVDKKEDVIDKKSLEELIEKDNKLYEKR